MPTPRARVSFAALLLLAATGACGDDTAAAGAGGAGGGTTSTDGAGGTDAPSTTSSAGGGTSQSTTTAGTGGEGGGTGGQGTGGGGGGGGSPATLEVETMADGLGASFALAVADGDLFYSDDATIVRCAADDCEATAAPFVDGHTVRKNGLRARDGYIYWATAEGTFRAAIDADVGDPELILEADARTITVDDASVIYTFDHAAETIVAVGPGVDRVTVADGVLDARGLVVDDGTLFYPSYGLPPDEAGVYAVPALGGDEPVELTAPHEQAGVAAVGVDAEHVYWASASSVMRCARGGCVGAPEELLADHGSYELLAVLDGDVFAAAYFGFLEVCEADDCAATRQQTDIGQTPQAMAWDDTHVYVLASSEAGTGVIVRVPRGG